MYPFSPPCPCSLCRPRKSPLPQLKKRRRPQVTCPPHSQHLNFPRPTRRAQQARAQRLQEPLRRSCLPVQPLLVCVAVHSSREIVGVGLMNCTCLAATPTITFFYVDGLTDYVRNTSKPFISPFFRKNPRAKPVFASFFSRKLIVFEFVQAHDGLGFSYCACSWYQIFV